ncbi:MAG: NB-ARC domain-containing protein [Bacteroidota bacterium]|jgi:LuxR family glucitol operon transcriptional activator
MSFSVTRLTLYAIISSIEEDLRAILNMLIADNVIDGDVFPKDVSDRARERMMKDTGIEDRNKNNVDLSLYVDLGELFQTINSHKQYLSHPLVEHLKSNTPGFQKILPVRNRIMHSRPLDFEDWSLTLGLAERLAQEKEEIWKSTNETLHRLGEEPGFVLRLEIPSYFRILEGSHHNLPVPDFDETGFIGRSELVKDLVKYCLGPYPVITIVGEGGLGKTAIALKVAYELLDLPNCPFDAIVWTSSKTAILTPTDIVKIEGAISDSLGIFKSIVNHLSGSKDVDSMTEVLEYLREFKILLIIDNLETVLDERVNLFLSQLPKGSKVLITSRIGIGAYEFPIKLAPFAPIESIQLLRAVASVRQMKYLVQMPNSKLQEYCEKLQYNPGFIKWFVSVVQTGKRPEEALQHPEKFLEFCMSNVYGYLTEESRKVLKSMVCLPSPHGLSELVFLNGIDTVIIQRSVQQLLTTNMVKMNSRPIGSSFETEYEISELAREYLKQYQPITREEFEAIKKLNKKLISAQEEIKGNLKNNPYSFEGISIAGKSNLIPAKLLLEASKMMRKDAPKALILAQQAKKLAPSYFEVHRVEGMIRYFLEDYVGARDCYEAAISIEPKYAPLRYWYAQFLLRAFDDIDGSLNQLREGMSLDPQSTSIKIEYSRLLIYSKEYDDAEKQIDALFSIPNLGGLDYRKLHDLRIQLHKRKAESLLNNRDYIGALTELEKLRESFQKCPPEYCDKRIYERVRDTVFTMRSCERSLEFEIREESFQKRCRELTRWFEITGNSGAIPIAADSAEFLYGRIINLLTTYGFIESNSGERLFFHRGAIVKEDYWENYKVNDNVSFILGANEKGRCAIEVKNITTNIK